jgi:hypothetical protein
MATLPQRNNNPGALRGSDGRIRAFGSAAEGWQALYSDLLAKMTGRTRTGLNGSSTLLQLFRVYAPYGDGANNPDRYAANVAARLGVPVSTPVGTLQGRVRELAEAIAIQEGFYAGQSISSPAPTAAVTLPSLADLTGGITAATVAGFGFILLALVFLRR